ncbi:glycosyltransferase family A protein [Pedobacter sp. WC2423]|uniref:glycosyltransferase family A protein n=1 Tax=Pedobacter sp. WC2423 TaxID=3234142 RepID=UPI003466318F
MEQMANGYYSVITWKQYSLDTHFPKQIQQLNLENDDDYLLFLKFEDNSFIPNIDTLKESLEIILSENDRTLIILTPKKNAPIETASEDEHVCSFCCNLNIFSETFNSIKNFTVKPSELLFVFLDRITMGSNNFDRIIVKQLPFIIKHSVTNNDCDVVIPHLGNKLYLKNVLHYLSHIKATTGYVGIDQIIDKEIAEIITNNLDISFYNFSPTPVGPYVIRNTLIDQGINKLIFFQDSDDLPCADRFEIISDYMYNNGCDLCGSHELRMDYYTKTVLAVRYPVDVTAALKDGPWHSLLHPASAIERKTFYECNKLSQERTFGNDTKFLLYSFFIIKNIKNVDEFLYIRKRHPNSLTTSPGTMMGSGIRRSLLRLWNNDFELIKSEELNLEQSSLYYQDSAYPVKFWKI